MAKLPVEIIRIGKVFNKDTEDTIRLLNTIQKELEFSMLPPSDEEKFQILEFKMANTHELLDKIKIIRNDLKGFHPYLIVISNIDLSDGIYNNLFGDAHPEEGVAIFTFKEVPEIIIPTAKIKSYIAYYVTRYTFNFLIPDHRNHDETKECVFDTKIYKRDIIKSMKAGAICDNCRITVMSAKYNLSASQFTALNILFGKVEELYTKDLANVDEKERKHKIFIGSSSEGLEVARKIQNELSEDFDIQIWNQGSFYKLGLSYLEVLEECVNAFDYGVFIFTPDDKIESRGETKTIARDNVIFELGMFIGKLNRKRAFLVCPKRSNIHILTDFSGITMANYDPNTSNLQAALGPVCDKIRMSII